VSDHSPDVAGNVFHVPEGVNFLTKPFPVQKIVQAIRNQLDRREA
jgi:hypothetical protein